MESLYVVGGDVLRGSEGSIDRWGDELKGDRGIYFQGLIFQFILNAISGNFEPFLGDLLIFGIFWILNLGNRTPICEASDLCSEESLGLVWFGLGYLEWPGFIFVDFCWGD